MSEGPDRFAARVRQAALGPERMLVVYLTLGDPVTGADDVIAAVVAAGADALEIGLPTPSTCPRGQIIRDSFTRARSGSGMDPDPWQACRAVRARAPDTALLALVYPETIADLGRDALFEQAVACGLDGLVLVAPTPALVAEVTAAGLSAIPVIGPDTPCAAELESAASQLTYRTLAARTGDALDLDSARRTAAELAAGGAARPFLVGFGIRSDEEIRALAPHAAGFVIGSELIRTLAGQQEERRAETAVELVRGWKRAARAAV